MNTPPNTVIASAKVARRSAPFTSAPLTPKINRNHAACDSAAVMPMVMTQRLSQTIDVVQRLPQNPLR